MKREPSGNFPTFIFGLLTLFFLIMACQNLMKQDLIGFVYVIPMFFSLLFANMFAKNSKRTQ